MTLTALAGIFLLPAEAARKTAGDVNFPAAPTPPPDKNGKYKAELVKLIEDGDKAQVYCLETYDTATLANFYTGKPLEDFIDNAREQKKAKTYMTASIVSRQIESFDIDKDAAQANIKMTEVWNMTLRRKPSGACLQQYKNSAIPQTVHFTRTAQGWRVSAVDFDGEPVSSPCDAKK